MFRRIILFLTVLLLTACTKSGAGQGEAPAMKGSQKAVVEVFDWGSSAVRTIITLDRPVTKESVEAAAFTVKETKEAFDWSTMIGNAAGPSEHIEASADRTVMRAYLSDAEGHEQPEQKEGNIITLEMAVGPDEGNILCFDMFTWHNTICNPYQLEIALKKGSSLEQADGTRISTLQIQPDLDLAGEALYPQLDGVDCTGTFTGNDGKTLRYVSYEPASDENLHPLVIWLHGAGEGGEDARMPVLGCKSIALFDEEFQKIMGGAYVLVPQTSTYWMQFDKEENWSGNPGTDSVFHESLMELIDFYLEQHPQIDPDRLYIGGCSNGGYMTMEMVLREPERFAAAFPICEAYMDSGISDEELAAIRDVPIWFVYAKNDSTVYPPAFEEATIRRLMEIGADVHASVFDTVTDTTGLVKDEYGNPYSYDGHWSWVYFFNNECKENGVSLWEWMAEQTRYEKR